MNGKQARRIRQIRKNFEKHHNLSPAQRRQLETALKKKFNTLTHTEKGNRE